MWENTKGCRYSDSENKAYLITGGKKSGWLNSGVKSELTRIEAQENEPECPSIHRGKTWRGETPGVNNERKRKG